MAPVSPQDSSSPSGPVRNLLRRINLRVRVMRLILFTERTWICLLPLLGVLAVFGPCPGFGYFRAVPDWLRLVSLGLFAVAFMASLLAFRRLRWPAHGAALVRLEKDNDIRHQALAVQSDKLSGNDAFARSLWQAHQKRMAESVDAVHVPPPRPDTPSFDPFGLRAVVVLFLVLAFAYSYSNQSGRLADAFVSHLPAAQVAGTRIDAWVTPPEYTGKAPVFLTGNTAGLPETITVPEGSEMLVRIVGGTGTESVVFDTGGNPVTI